MSFFQVLPALKSFCIYCGIGILMVYFLQVTFFTGCMVLDQVLYFTFAYQHISFKIPKVAGLGLRDFLDLFGQAIITSLQRRQEARRNGFFPCIKHSDPKSVPVVQNGGPKPVENGHSKDVEKSLDEDSVEPTTCWESLREGNLLQSIFAAYARWLTKWPSKVIQIIQKIPISLTMKV